MNQLMCEYAPEEPSTLLVDVYEVNTFRQPEQKHKFNSEFFKQMLTYVRTDEMADGEKDERTEKHGKQS